MIGDEARVSAYAGALRALVRPGDRVLEIGAGFGFFSVVAARAGAAHVDAVEMNPAVHLGPKVAAQNACADRITFHHADATRVTLDVPADLLLLDLRGPTPFGARSLDVLLDARSRLLRRGGTIVAARDTVFAAPSRTPAAFQHDVQAAHGREHIAMNPVERVVYDTPRRCPVAPGDLLAPGQPWAQVDYQTVESFDCDGVCEWTLDSAGEAAGLAVWFESDVGAGFTYSNGPSAAGTAYRQIFLPFQTPVPIAPGDRVRIRLGVRQVDDRYVWEWQMGIASGGDSERLAVSQNSLAELVIDPAALPQTASNATPNLGPRGRALRDLLANIDGTRTVSDLATLVRQGSPTAVPDHRAAVRFVSRTIARLDRLEQGLE
jgi:precorrin-6B methylase 2